MLLGFSGNLMSVRSIAFLKQKENVKKQKRRRKKANSEKQVEVFILTRYNRDFM
jgi:hypothetical protein